jgi:hypothetical protein
VAVELLVRNALPAPAFVLGVELFALGVRHRRGRALAPPSAAWRRTWPRETRLVALSRSIAQGPPHSRYRVDLEHSRTVAGSTPIARPHGSSRRRSGLVQLRVSPPDGNHLASLLLVDGETLTVGRTVEKRVARGSHIARCRSCPSRLGLRVVPCSDHHAGASLLRCGRNRCCATCGCSTCRRACPPLFRTRRPARDFRCLRRAPWP